MLNAIFVLLVIVGFIMWFIATWPVPLAERIARGCFMVAAIIWGVGAWRH